MIAPPIRPTTTTKYEMAIGNLSGALLIGGLLILLVLGAVLFDWRAGLISAIAIPVSLTAGALVLYFRGASVNTMVVAGFLMALALVIDDAVLDVDQIVRRLRYRQAAGSAESTWALIMESTLEVRSAALYAALCGIRQAKGAPSREDREFRAQHRPWGGGAWSVKAELKLADGRLRVISDLEGLKLSENGFPVGLQLAPFR